jgi:hypothetical protein
MNGSGGFRMSVAATVIDGSVSLVSERECRFVLLVFAPESGVCFRLDGFWTTPSPKTVIEISTSTWSANERPGVRPRREWFDSQSCCLHVGNCAGFRASRHSVLFSRAA